MRYAKRLRSAYQEKMIEAAQRGINKVPLYSPSALTTAIAYWDACFIIDQHVDEFVEFALKGQQPHDPEAAKAHFERTIIRDSRLNVEMELSRWRKQQDFATGRSDDFNEVSQ